MPVAGDTFRRVAILDIRRWAATVARASQRRLELALNNRLDLDEIAVSQARLDSAVGKTTE